MLTAARLAALGAFAVLAAVHDLLPTPYGEVSFASGVAALIALAAATEVLRHKSQRLSAQLHQTHESNQSLVESLPLVTYVDELAPPAKPRYISPQVEALLGYPVGEWDDEGLFWRIVHADDLDRVWAAHAQLREPGDGFGIEYRLYRADGETVWVYDEAHVSDSGADPHVKGFLLDITERKAAEHERAHLAAIVESSEDAIISTDETGRIVAWNRGAERMYGHSAAEAIGQNMQMTIPAEERESVRARLAAIMREGRAQQWEAVRYRRDGTAFNAAITVSPIRDAGGKIIALSGIIRDITDQKRLEDELRQAQKMEAIGQLAGGVAHDFNNALMAIRGYSELLLRRLDDDDPRRRDAVGIKKAADGAAAMTRQLLAFSRRQMLQPQILDLNSVVVEMTAMLRPLLGENIELDLHLGSDLGRVHADPSQIEHAIMNLAVNARDAMPDGGTVTISTANFEFDEAYVKHHVVGEPGLYVMLEVADTGVGMSDEVKERMFEPFFTTKEVGKGTGMGLSSVYGIVKQSGGYIWPYSEEGGGTSIKIYLPVAEAASLGDTQEARTDEIPRGDGSETILLVEDEDMVRSVARQMLESLGYEVVSAKSGTEAVALVKGLERPIALVLTDVVMPQMNGMETLRAIDAIRPGVRALFMSGYPNDVVGDGIRGDAPFLQKPFTTAALARSVRELLDADEAVAA